MNRPNSLSLANLPTQIYKLERLSNSLGKNIYIKRDDQTGTEVTGNKVRKLEFAVQEALDQGCNHLITCGGIQSNHARATAATAAKLGLGCHVVLRGSENDKLEGNYFLGKVLGAKVKLITPEEYRDSRMEIMESLKDILATEGVRAYIIPEGASNGIGSFGYYKAMEEVIEQQREMGLKFDAVVTTVGSGGTYAGLLMANSYYQNGAEVYGVNICDSAEHFTKVVTNLIEASNKYLTEKINVPHEELRFLDGYVGDGYAKSRVEELEFIRDIAKLEGIILDPVYTGKAMRGLVSEIKKGTFNHLENILFIHTGGLFGLLPTMNFTELL